MHSVATIDHTATVVSDSFRDAKSILPPLPVRPLQSELDFYHEYSWSLNVFPTFSEVIYYLGHDLERFEQVESDWRRSEVWTNVHLLAGTLTNSVDDYLLGDRYDLSKVAGKFPFLRPGVRGAERVLNTSGPRRAQRHRRLLAWREKWSAAIDELLLQSFVNGTLTPVISNQTKQRCLELLRAELPSDLLNERVRIPAYFRSRDFTHFDAIFLGRKFLTKYPDSNRPVLIAGLRTAGSFLAPLICAFLRNQGFCDADWVSFRPRKALSAHETNKLQQAFSKGARVAIVDEPVLSGSTVAKTVSILRGVGFSNNDIVSLLPVDPAFQQWKDSVYIQSLSGIGFVPLEPQERYKQRFVESTEIDQLLNEYFRHLGYESARVTTSARLEAFNHEWWSRPPEKADSRMKRIFEVELSGPQGTEIRYVLAKSVGWGWMGYNSFLAGEQLRDCVPPMLGQRNGILFTEWLPQDGTETLNGIDRASLIETVSSYIASRARSLKFEGNISAGFGREGSNRTFDHLAGVLAKAYSSRVVAALKRPAIRQQLDKQKPPTLALADGRMAYREWIRAGSRLLKTDFEHHGQGKNETCTVDPAFDLADAILQFGLSKDESAQLIQQYTEMTGDEISSSRLFINKLAAGTWSQVWAINSMHDRRQLRRQKDYHRQYLAAWNFLVTETVRECGNLCHKPSEIVWRNPIIALDIDGVLDRMVFSFPSATAAAIQAVSIFHTHGCTIALDTARTLREVKEYCNAYGFAGGAAEYGSVVWDAVSDRALPLVSRESFEQLKEIRKALENIPGVFLNEDYEFSVRAFTYHTERTQPLPALVAENLIARLNADRLKIHHTGSDTAILAKEIDKGVGLRGLLALAGVSDAKVFAVGDSEPDLPMFRAANRAFAPSQITCGNIAQGFGCQIADRPGPVGLLSIAHTIAHPDGGTCDRCKTIHEAWPHHKDLFVELLEAADQTRWPLLRQALKPLALLTLFKK